MNPYNLHMNLSTFRAINLSCFEIGAKVIYDCVIGID